MGLFGPPPPMVTPYEFKMRVIPELIANHSFSNVEIDDIRKLVFGAQTGEGEQKSVNAKELKEIILWLKQNKTKHAIKSDEHIHAFEEIMHKYLAQS